MKRLCRTVLVALLILYSGTSLAGNTAPIRYPMPGDPVRLSQYEYLVNDDTVVRLFEAGLVYDPVETKTYYIVVVVTYAFKSPGPPSYIPEGIAFDTNVRVSPGRPHGGLVQIHKWKGLVFVEDETAIRHAGPSGEAREGQYMSLRQSDIARPRNVTVALHCAGGELEPKTIQFNIEDIAVLDSTSEDNS